MHRHITNSLILLLTFCTGFSGLVYEVVWHSYLANLIGSHARSAAIIVAVFLGGLSTGYLLFGKLSRKRSPASLLVLYGWAELAIGIWALLFPALLPRVAALPLPEALHGLTGDCLRCVLLMGIPTLLMGGTLPLLTQALARTLSESASLHTRIYAVNTAGAFLGCLLAGFVIIPFLGLPLTVISMGLINAVAGSGILLLSRTSAITDTTPDSAHQEHLSGLESTAAVSRFLLPATLTVSFISGFVSISLQIIVMRLIGLSAGSSPYAFSMAVSAFILMLALGAWRLSEKRTIPISLTSNQTLAAAGMLLILLTVPCWPYATHVIRTLLTSVPFNFVTFHLALFTALSLILLPAVGFMGNTLPTLFRLIRSDLGSLGSRVGWLYSVNTAGCVCGALFGGYLFLYYLDFFDILRMLSVVLVISMLLASLVIEQRQKLLTLLASALCILALLIISPWPLERLGVGIFRMKSPTPSSYKGAAEFHHEFLGGRTILAYKDDPNTTVAVLRSLNGDLSIHVNGKSDGSTGGSDKTTTKLLAHLPLLLGQQNQEQVAVIGFGTGLTAGTAALYPEIKRLDVIEIAPFIRDFAPLFDFANGDSSKNPAIIWHLEDAYRFLTRSEYKGLLYDTIISEPSNPWVAGVERLYTTEFYNLARTRLKPGGIYTQWFHTYSMSRETLALVLNTFHRSWKHVRVFVNDMDLILLGSETALDVDRLKLADERAARPAIRQDLAGISLPSLPALLAGETAIPRQAFEAGGIQTLDFPKLSYQAGYDFFLDASITPDTFAEDPRWRRFHYRQWNNSLLATLLRHSAEQLSLKAIASLMCRTDTPAILPGWQKLTRSCRLALLAAAARDDIENHAQDAEATIRVLKEFSAPSPTRMESTPEQRLTRLRILNESISSWYRPNRNTLTAMASDCGAPADTAAQNCRLLLAQAALWSDQADLVEQILAPLSAQTMPAQMKQNYELLQMLSH